MWYLGHARHNPDQVPKRRRFADYILDAAEEINERVEDDEDEEQELVELNEDFQE
jgi:hypothetical protein